MKRVSRLLSIAALILSASCYKTVRSDPLIEDGIFLYGVFRPYHVHIYNVPVTHTDVKGHTTVDIETHTDHYSEEHWCVFACKHGQFTVDNESVWKKLSPNMKVKIKYRQLDTFKEKDGKQFHMGTDYEFEDANPADAEWNGAR